MEMLSCRSIGGFPRPVEPGFVPERKVVQRPAFQAGSLAGASPAGNATFDCRFRIADCRLLRSCAFAPDQSAIGNWQSAIPPLSRCNQCCTPLCEGGGSWCKST